MRIIIFLLIFTSLTFATSPQIYNPKENESVDVKPNMIFQPEFIIPDNYKISDEDLKIWMSVLVNNEGKVAEANIEFPCLDSILNEIVLKTVMKYEFNPAIKEGNPVWFWIWWKINIKTHQIDLTTQQNNYKVKLSFDEKLPSPNEFVPVEVQPEMIYYKAPEYPRLAKQAGTEGVVLVKVLVDKSGNVLKAQVSKTSGTSQLDKSAVDAAFGNKFSPAIQDGRPVAIWVTYKVDFSLEH